jgi:NAD/NADP transhydrogenase alpha subunit
MPFHASEMYARTIINFLMYLLHEGQIQIKPDDELARATLLTNAGEIVSNVVAQRRIS